jgi:hypothetical protein
MNFHGSSMDIFSGISKKKFKTGGRFAITNITINPMIQGIQNKNLIHPFEGFSGFFLMWEQTSCIPDIGQSQPQKARPNVNEIRNKEI